MNHTISLSLSTDQRQQVKHVSKDDPMLSKPLSVRTKSPWAILLSNLHLEVIILSDDHFI